MSEITKYLKDILEWMLNNVQEIEINESEDVFWVLLEVRVSKDDMPLLIWKSWKNINSLRTIIRQYGSKIWKKVNIKIIEN
jgi:predicted RNA-binding protein YlqC (UPF0109 family)